MAYSRNSIVCDSSALISMTDSCFLPLLYELREKMDSPFLIPKTVRFESIERPMRIREYSLAALRLAKAEADGVIETVPIDVSEKKEEFLWAANNLFFIRGKPFTLVQAGEADAIALAGQIGAENILIDERTTRMLIEAPLALKEHMEKEFETPIELNEKFLQKLKELAGRLNAFRSSELIALAFEQGFFKRFGANEKKALEAALYGIKFAGCAVSFSEIDEFVRGV